MRTVFFGTPEIAAVVLEALRDVSDVVAAVCQPDRPAGRGLKLKAPAAKACAMAAGIEVVQPDKLRTKAFSQWLRDKQADVAVVIAYGRIFGKGVLQAPRRGCMNLHASLLPRYRGAAPINWAIARGETTTGISLMQMDKGCDTGPVYSQRSLDIGANETAGELYQRLGQLAADVVRADLRKAVDGELEAVPQDDALATMAPIISKDDGRVDWSRPAQEVHDLVRGMTPWPGAHCQLGGKLFKLLDTRLATQQATLQATQAEAGDAAGTIVRIADEGALVACGEGGMWLRRGQVAGKKPLTAQQLAAGRTLCVGSQLS